MLSNLSYDLGKLVILKKSEVLLEFFFFVMLFWSFGVLGGSLGFGFEFAFYIPTHRISYVIYLRFF